MTFISNDRSFIDELLPQHAIVVWFTGLSGAGKSTIAFALKEHLIKNGFFSLILDGNLVREGINKDLGFSLIDRFENIRRVAEIARILINNRIISICAFISPTNEIRQCARNIIGQERFFEIYVKTTLEICEERDPLGLYKKSRMGKLNDFTGVSSPFEIPENPDLIIDTHHVSVEKNVDTILEAILPKLRIL